MGVSMTAATTSWLTEGTGAMIVGGTTAVGWPRGVGRKTTTVPDVVLRPTPALERRRHRLSVLRATPILAAHSFSQWESKDGRNRAS